MNNQPLHHSAAWVAFTYATFLLSLVMIGAGVVFMPIDPWMKSFLGMAVVLLVQSCVTLTKTLRDNAEAEKLVNRIEDAKTERLLMDVAKAP
ncbi:MAG TPA: YiaA/YiaB family inner membrane protein [Methylocystis sp.]|nr:YiaA/YiaB family inner membrane protein [Methylocystis sp.]